jgi:hypothetical protein
MAARLGNILFWLGIIIAVGWLALSYFAISTTPGGHPFGAAEFLTVTVIPIISASVGWALRYILSGR